VWSEEKDVGRKNRLPVSCVFRADQDGVPMGLQEGAGGEPDEIHGKGGVRVHQDNLPKESGVVSFRSIQPAKPLLFV